MAQPAFDRSLADELVAERLLAEAVIATGTFKSPGDGHGYVSPDEGDGDLFVHSFGDARQGSLPSGTRVEFEVHTGPHGLEAFDVVPLAFH